MGVAGAGTMGAGIAQVACLAGFDTVLYDPDAAALDRGRELVAVNLERGATRGRWTAEQAAEGLRGLTTAGEPDALAPCGVVIEAAPESLELKRELFASLERVCAPNAVLASNTSSMSVTEIARPLARPERVCGLHFFNPPALMRLVEVVATDWTAGWVTTVATELASAMGRTPVRCADSPGFIVNRCNRPFSLESLRMLSEGIASAEEIDLIARDDGGFPMGPFELIDLIGVDVNLEVARSFYAQRPLARWRPHPAQEQLVRDGRLGRKSGAGFHEYDAEGRRRGRGAAKPSRSVRNLVLDRLLSTLANEACFAAGEGVATPADIDTAMRLGLNHPVGPFERTAELGPQRAVTVLERLAEADAERYEVAPVLRRWADGVSPSG